MGNRSKYLAVSAAAGAAVVAARRRARLHHAVEGIQDAILPTHVVADLPSDRDPGADEAHAPGHQHLPARATDEPAPVRLRGRPWTKHAHGMTHPFARE